jgi:hypothetical protein
MWELALILHALRNGGLNMRILGLTFLVVVGFLLIDQPETGSGTYTII